MSKRKDKREEKDTTTKEPPARKGRKVSKKEATEPPEKRVKTEIDYKDMVDDYRLPYKKINAHITCSICKGYLVDATTVIECLHTFCKSCLMAHFEDEDNNCPKCKQLIHQSHPSHYVAFDRTVQDIVYKLVPGMFDEEKKRRLDFIRKQNKAEGKKDFEEDKKDEPLVGASNKCYDAKPMESHHRKDEQIVIELQPAEGLPKAARNIIRLSDSATVNTLKRYLALCLYKDVTKYNTLDIFYNNEFMGNDHSMKFIHRTRCRYKPKDEPLRLEYRNHFEF